MKNFNYGEFREALRLGTIKTFKITFGLTYWIFSSLMILFGGMMKGAALGITFFILYLIAYIFISKVSKILYKKAHNDYLNKRL